MKSNEATVPVFFNKEQFKTLLSGNQYSEKEIDLLFDYLGKCDSSQPITSLSGLLDDWIYEKNGRKIFAEFEDILSFNNFCKVMGFDPTKDEDEAAMRYAQAWIWPFLVHGSVEDVLDLEYEGFFYKKEAVRAIHEQLKKYDVFNREPTVSLGMAGYNKRYGVLHLKGTGGHTETVDYIADGLIKAIILEEEEEFQDLRDVFCAGLVAPFQATENFDYFPDRFFGCMYTFADGLKIYNQDELVYEAAADIIRVFRYGECGFIIQLLSE